MWIDSTVTNFFNTAGVEGEAGDLPEFNYGNSSATSYDWIIKFGKGGDAHKGGKGGKPGTITLKNLVTPNALTLSSQGSAPGGGGGGGYLYGANGASGEVIIHYW